MRIVTILSILVTASNDASACNRNNILTSYIEEWASDNESERDRIRDMYNKAMTKEYAYVVALSNGFKDHFRHRAAPLNELSKCDDTQILSSFDAAIGQGR